MALGACDYYMHHYIFAVSLFVQIGSASIVIKLAMPIGSTGIINNVALLPFPFSTPNTITKQKTGSRNCAKGFVPALFTFISQRNVTSHSV